MWKGTLSSDITNSKYMFDPSFLIIFIFTNDIVVLLSYAFLYFLFLLKKKKPIGQCKTNAGSVQNSVSLMTTSSKF